LAAATFMFIPMFAMCCAVLAVFNLLPIKSLDGGRIVECALLMRMGEDEAARVIYVLSFIFIVILWIISVYLLLYAPFNPTLFFICVYLFAAIFLKKV
jgi:stage IV sporulation protein FB